MKKIRQFIKNIFRRRLINALVIKSNNSKTTSSTNKNLENDFFNNPVVKDAMFSCFNSVNNAINKNFKTTRVYMNSRLSREDIIKIGNKIKYENLFIKSFFIKTLKCSSESNLEIKRFLVFSFNMDKDGNYKERE